MDSSHLFFSNRTLAVVSNPITPGDRGRIHYQCTDWYACTLNDEAVSAGAIVELLERNGNTWLVIPYTSTPAQRRTRLERSATSRSRRG